jgi:hypothetical protein
MRIQVRRWKQVPKGRVGIGPWTHSCLLHESDNGLLGGAIIPTGQRVSLSLGTYDEQAIQRKDAGEC